MKAMRKSMPGARKGSGASPRRTREGRATGASRWSVEVTTSVGRQHFGVQVDVLHGVIAEVDDHLLLEELVDGDAEVG
jgi:hypothetical protein